ncbi:MAG: T9SS type A sorting domain-containing protein [Bacteroidota bacterium]
MKKLLLCFFIVMSGAMTATTIKNLAGPTNVSTTVTNSTCGQANGFVTIGSVTGGVAPYQYNFNGDGYVSTTAYPGLAAGNYTLDVKDSNGDIYTTSVTIIDSPGPTAVATTVTNTSCGNADGCVTFGAVTGGTAPYTHNFNNTGFNTTLNYCTLSAGSYPLEVKDANGCIFTTTITIVDNSGVTNINSTKTDVSSCGGSDGSIIINSVTGGVSPYEYNFENTGYTSVTSYTGLSQGVYSIIVRDANGCIYSSSFFIGNTSIAAPTTSSVTQPTCAVPTGTIVFTTQSGVEYTIDNGVSYQTGTTFSGLIPGTYTLMVRNTTDNTCTAMGANPVTLNLATPTTPTTASITQPSCAVPTGTIVVNAQAGVEYSVNGTTWQASATFSGLAPGTYTITVRNVADNTCSATASSTVTINAVPSAPTVPTFTVTQPSCAQPTGTIIVDPQAGLQYSINNGTVYQASNTFSGVSPGTYTIRVRNSADTTCSTNAATLATINSAPSAPTQVTTNVVAASCGVSDGSINITGAVGGTSPYTYDFNNGGFSATTSYTGLVSGIYPIVVKDVNGCTYSRTETITNSGGPTNIATTTVNSSCGASDGMITLGAVTGGTGPYQYQFNSGGYGTVTSFTSLAAGSYGINVKDANGCIFSTTVTVSNNPGPTAIATIVNNASCGNPNGSITIGTVTGGTAPYIYAFNGGAFSPTTNFTSLAAGSYVLDVRDANGCIFSTIVTIIDNPGPTAIASTVVNESCGNANGSLTLGAVTGGTAPYSYQFYPGGYNTATSYTGLPAGSYGLDVKDANGCVYSTSVTITNTICPLDLSMNGTYVDYNADGFTNIGDVINYQFTITNTYASPVTDIIISNYNMTTTGYLASLASGASDSITFTAVHVINQTDINNGSVNVDAVATGTYNSSSITAVATITTPLNISDSIKLIAFIDSNGNSIKDASEMNYTSGEFHYELNNNGIIHNIDSSYGQHSIYDTNAANSYDVSYTINSPYYTVNPSSYSNITIANGSGTTTYNFPVTTASYTDLIVNLYQSGVGPRPGFTYQNQILVRNNGNQTIPAGTLTFTKDNRVSITNVSPSATMNGTGFTYNYPSLAPNQSFYIFVTMQVPTIPTIQLGDLLTNTVSVAIPAGDVFPSNNSASLTQDIRGSYDPNDKNESHGPQIVHSTFTSADYLSYTIQFENTGTANAVTVKVDDVLDAKLDETSIKMIDASHNYTLDRVGNDLTWNFEGINLPPSIAGTSTGKGYINFQIKPKAGYAVGDIINNTAFIYFDFNPAIVTNTFATEFVTALGVQGFVNSQFSAYPNPTTGIITIALKNSAGSIDNITVTDVLGKTVLSNTVNTSNTIVDLSNLTKGLYFVRIQAEGLVKTLKVVKE